MVHERAEHASDSSAVISDHRSVSEWPWSYRTGGPHGDYIIDGADCDAIASVSSEYDARLIAAAPDMLEALKELMKIAAVFGTFQDELGQSLERDFKAVIAKAEGK